jgi:predicted glycosyltransferase
MGFDPTQPNFLVRRVAWRSSHDLGQSGFSDEVLIELVHMLEETGVVHVSSETEVPAVLADRLVDGKAGDFHHLLAHCRLVVGESATVTCEATILGVPAIYCAADRRSYLDELEALGLVRIVRDVDADHVLASVRSVLRTDPGKWQALCDDWRGGLANLAPRVADAIVHHASAGNAPFPGMSAARGRADARRLRTP